MGLLLVFSSFSTVRTKIPVAIPHHKSGEDYCGFSLIILSLFTGKLRKARNTLRLPFHWLLGFLTKAEKFKRNSNHNGKVSRETLLKRKFLLPENVGKRENFHSIMKASRPVQNDDSDGQNKTTSLQLFAFNPIRRLDSIFSWGFMTILELTKSVSGVVQVLKRFGNSFNLIVRVQSLVLFHSHFNWSLSCFVTSYSGKWWPVVHLLSGGESHIHF